MADPMPPRLPRGRHGLTRAQVAADQRARILVALAAAMAERGFGATTVADVLRRAGVSRESFYEHFDSKLDCFLQAFDAAAELLVADMGERGGLEPAGTAFERLARAVDAYLRVVCDHPAEARLFLVESWAAGPAALERRVAVQAQLADGLGDLLGLDGEDDRFAAQAFVAAIGTMVSTALAAGDVAGVAALREPAVRLAERTLLPAPGSPDPRPVARRYARRSWTG